jgi:hypothetical protein
MPSTIGRYAVIRLLFLVLLASPLHAAADQSSRESSLQRATIDGCAAFDTEGSCLTGVAGGKCNWHPRDGCISATTTARMNDDRVYRTGKEEGMRASRNLQATTKPTTGRPTTRRPTNSPTTRRPTNRPTTRRPTNRPTSRPSVSRFRASFSFLSIVRN